jgi:hypothetical protein
MYHRAIIVCFQHWSKILAATNLEMVASLWLFVTIDDNKTEDESSSQDMINASVVAGIIWINVKVAIQLNEKYYFFLVALRTNVEYGLLIHEVSKSRTTHYSRYDSSGRVISSSQRPLPDNT